MSDKHEAGGGAKAPPPVVEDPGSRKDPAAVLGASGNESLSFGDIKSRGNGGRRGPSFIDAFLPNRAVSVGTMRLLILAEAAIALVIWITSPFQVLPQPGEVLKALSDLWMTQGLGPELFTSFGMSLQAIAMSAVISLLLSYLTVLPVFRPLVAGISKGRFLSLVGFTFIFTLLVGGGRPLKLSLLVFGMSVFFVTSMASVIAQIPKEDFDYARTLRMSEWQVVWEVVVLGTAAQAWEVLRQNAAIGWMMLTMVEGISRSEGGVGAMLLNQSKHFHLAEVFAIQILILAVGLLQDYGIGVLRRFTCPYADLTLERKDR
jgi:NitT/TauT family transport system permease protein